MDPFVLLFLLGWVAASEVTSETVRSGALRTRVLTDDADLVLFYVSEHDGRLGTCGCPSHPRGGLARLDTYVRGARHAAPDTPTVLVHAGGWASTRIADTTALRPDAEIANTWMLRGLDAAEFDAINLSFQDTPWLRTAPVPERAVSLHLRSTQPDRGPEAFRVVHSHGLAIAITGISRQGMVHLQPEDTRWDEPLPALRAQIAQMEAAADVVVVLAFGTGRDTREIARVDGVDVVIEAGDFTGKDVPDVHDGTVWVRSRDEGQSVGELRLWLQDGRVVAAHDRWVDLDDALTGSRALRSIEKRSEREVAASLRAQLE